MTDQTTAEPVATPVNRGRFALGMLFFVLGLICPVFVPLVTSSALPASAKAALSGLLMLGVPELLWLVAVAFMGKAGFQAIKSRLIGVVFGMVPERVSRTRYRLGLVLFATPILFGWLSPYAPRIFPGYEEYPLAYQLSGDVMLLSSLFVLGGEFWDKVRSIFLYDAKVTFPAPAEPAKPVAR